MRRSVFAILGALLLVASGTAWAQEHAHGPASGIAHGIPRICTGATVTTAADGAWSSAATWSTGRVPAAGDKVLIRPGARVVYDMVSDAPIACIDVEGALIFRTNANTRLTVGTMTVLETGRLEVGSPEAPIPADVTAEIVIVDQPVDTMRDPEQLTVGIIGLGAVRMHGAVRTPTFSRVTAEPLAGQTTLRLEQPVSGWKVGDKLVVPDTRQLKRTERGSEYVRQWEELTVAAVSGDTVTLSAPLAFNHRGARTAAGEVEFLPHVGNVSRNVIVRSANAAGTRGHVIFVRHPDVDIRYALFKDLGRTRMGVLNNTEFNSDGTIRRVGTNQIGRYSIHFHHAFGPRKGRPDGYQFTLVGNAVDDASKWGITIHNSHYGLIEDNVVYNSRGAAIVTEDGNESFNIFQHNFAMRSEGSGEFAPRSGYGGATSDPGGEGAAFWFRGPNNIIRRNVAANVDVFGFGIAAGAIEEVRVPAFKGADNSQTGEFKLIDDVDTPLMEFTDNEAYGAILNGVALGWNGTISNMRVWHASRDAVAVFPADRLTVEGLTVRGDVAVLADPTESPTGVWFSNYSAKSVTVRNANVQAVRVGVASPFFPNASMEPGRGDGVATIENSFFRNYVGVAVATAYTPSTTTAPIKKAVVRNSRFEALPGVRPAQYPAAAISMNYGMSFGDTTRRDPIVVYDFNGRTGDTFRVFYSLELPTADAPACNTPRQEIGGFVCAGDDATQETRR